MTELAKSVARDNGNDGLMGTGDVYGFAVNSIFDFASYVVGCGNFSLSKNENDTFEIAVDSDHAIRTIDKVLELYASEALSAESTNASLKAFYDDICKVGTPYYDEKPRDV